MPEGVSATGPHGAPTRALHGLIEVTRFTRSEELFQSADEAMYEAKRSDGHVAIAP